MQKKRKNLRKRGPTPIRCVFHTLTEIEKPKASTVDNPADAAEAGTAEDVGGRAGGSEGGAHSSCCTDQNSPRYIRNPWRWHQRLLIYTSLGSDRKRRQLHIHRGLLA